MAGADVQVIVPAKRLAEAKSRLRPCLGDPDRETLVLDMLARVVGAARGASRVAAVAVVTPDARIARVARACGADVLADHGRDLNASLRAALTASPIARAAAWLILPADLPDLTATAVDDLLAQIETAGRMAVMPDQHLTGTNALAWRGARFDGLRFGHGSFAAHGRAGRAAGFTVLDQPATPAFFDLDDAEGLARLGGRPRAASASCFLEANAHA